jgi:hypothetical protein
MDGPGSAHAGIVGVQRQGRGHRTANVSGKEIHRCNLRCDGCNRNRDGRAIAIRSLGATDRNNWLA